MSVYTSQMINLHKSSQERLDSSKCNLLAIFRTLESRDFFAFADRRDQKRETRVDLSRLRRRPICECRRDDNCFCDTKRIRSRLVQIQLIRTKTFFQSKIYFPSLITCIHGRHKLKLFNFFRHFLLHDILHVTLLFNVSLFFWRIDKLFLFLHYTCYRTCDWPGVTGQLADNLLEERHQLQFHKAASSGVVEIVRVVEDNDARAPQRCLSGWGETGRRGRGW